MRDSVDSASRREPAFNVPWPVWTLVATLLIAFLLQKLSQDGGAQFALTARDLNPRDGYHLLSYLFVHAGWAHVLMNGAFTLTFGTPVARYLGLHLRGAMAFAGFFLLCGALAALGYAAWADVFSPGASWALVGASGAASGLFGAAARLIEGRGGLGSWVGRRFLGMSAAWIIANVALGVSGLTPGATGAPVAWQAHVFGFLAGLVLIGPAAALAGRRRDHVIAP